MTPAPELGIATGSQTPGPRPGQLVTALGAPPVAILAAASTGFNAVTLRIEGPRADTRRDEAALAAMHRRRLTLDPHGFNELRFTPTRCAVNRIGQESHLELAGSLTDYAAYLAAQQTWDRLGDHTRRTRCQGGLATLGAHGVGVSSVVQCTDGRILLLQRSDATVWYPEHWAILAEGAAIHDVEVGSDGTPIWDPGVTARRGLAEELGVASREVAWRNVALVADVTTGALSILGRARIPYTSTEALAAWRDAPDADEAVAVELVAWEFDALDEIATQLSPIVPVDAVALVGAFALDAGWALCEARGWITTLE